MAIEYKLLGSASITSATNTVIYTVPTGKQVEIKVIWLCNVVNADNTIEMWHVPSGSSAADSNKRMSTLTIPQNDFKKIQADWQLAAGDKIEAKVTSTNLSVTIALYGAVITL